MRFSGNFMPKKALLLFFCAPYFLMLPVSVTAQVKLDHNNQKQGQPFTVGYVEWMPFSGRNENGEPIGMDIEILQEAFKKTPNYELVFQYVEWKDSMLNVLQETIDSTWVCYLTQKRMKAFDYSTFYNYETLHVFVPISSSLRFTTIKDLEGRKVMLAYGYSAGDEYDENRDVIKMTSRTDEQALLELAAGKIDAVITGELVGYYYIQKNNLHEKIKMLDVPVGLFPLHGIVKKFKNYDFLKQFEIAVVQLQDEGIIKSIREKWKRKLGIINSR